MLQRSNFHSVNGRFGTSSPSPGSTSSGRGDSVASICTQGACPVSIPPFALPHSEMSAREGQGEARPRIIEVPVASGCLKTRYRGLAKNRAQLFTLFALGNLFLVRRRLPA